MKAIINNPILRGFHPDPSILKVEDTYYLAVSSFEWLPGIRVYCSQDLVNWSHETDILTNQVDLLGNAANCSIWAPQISYANGQYYCVYTNVRNTKRPFKDCRNYLITAPTIHGPWSEPIYLNGSGFDPSLFHDQEGRIWLLNALWDYRKDTPNKSVGIVLQEYSEAQGCLIGDRVPIFSGTQLAKTEAPHLYYHNECYYLLTAEGGTGAGHAVTVCRSKTITGPYEVDPHFPMMRAYQREDSPFQCTGHGSLTIAPSGEWVMSYLMTRPVEGAAILGRETALQTVYWDHEGWLRLSNNDTIPDQTIRLASDAQKQRASPAVFIDDFKGSLQKAWNGRRLLPNEEWCNLSERPGYLRLIGGESMQSNFHKHLLAIRQQDFCFEAETVMEYHPQSFNQMAGLSLFLNEENYLFFYVTYDEKEDKVLRLLRCCEGEFHLFPDKLPLAAASEPIGLKVVGSYLEAQWFYRQSQTWHPFKKQSIQFLSGGFTGNFIGISAHDLDHFGKSYADFEYFTYQGKDPLDDGSLKIEKEG
ncbi:glycoside hydrolase family 43 protein [Enterococcus casseliflavus]|uniref:glycoside hydrolase family 43 protein n=1 Tax=Enterococcus casseliflavus TaxID=37734 RepID=UPI00143283B4|nr:glycoside hydrolase family 43 protein [Enterococcus casseliflavus]NKD33383.1 glycoside hydrolase family 43 protein [Enterococcus casseliflavus]